MYKLHHFEKTTPLLPFWAETTMYRAFQDGSSLTTTPVLVPFFDYFVKGIHYFLLSSILAIGVRPFGYSRTPFCL